VKNFVAVVTLGGQASWMARHHPKSTQACGVPQEVCEDFNFASAREEIKK